MAKVFKHWAKVAKIAQIWAHWSSDTRIVKLFGIPDGQIEALGEFLLFRLTTPEANVKTFLN